MLLSIVSFQILQNKKQKLESQLLIMATTFQEKGNPHLICHGYIRLNCDDLNQQKNVSLTFPLGIISIIIDYFLNPFEWDSEKCHDYVTISDDKLTVNNKQGGNGAVFAKNLLSSQALTAANWEITIKSLTEGAFFSMGHVTHDMIQSVKVDDNLWIGDEQGQYSMSVIADEGVFEKGNDAEYKAYDKKWDPEKVKQGDRFEIRFDFIKQKSSCYWNGNFIGILDDKLCDKIYPAMTITGGHEIECTKWKLKYIKH